VCSDQALLDELLRRFHTALLYDLRHGAHRFTSRMSAADVASGLLVIPAAQPGAIVAITPERPAITSALRSMFPTDVHFGALPLESIDLVAPLVASRAIFIQFGWLMAPLRLLRPYLLAASTIRTLRQTTNGWIAAAAAAASDQGANPGLRALGIEMKRLFQVPLLAGMRLQTRNVLFTSAVVKYAPPRCAREYMMRAERGDPGAKLEFGARWGMLRLLRGLGHSRFEIQRAFLSEKGMATWYPDPRRRTIEGRQRKATLAEVFRRPLTERHVSCKTLALFGACPFRGDVAVCCAHQTRLSLAEGRAFNVWNPMQVAKLGAPRVAVEIDGQPEANSLLIESLYVVKEQPARLYHAAGTRL
jgi:hypothetical protein